MENDQLNRHNAQLEGKYDETIASANQLQIRISQLQAHKYRAEQLEKNLQNGHLALLGAMGKLKEENKELKAASAEAQETVQKYNDASRNLKITNERLRRAEDKIQNMKANMDKLERENLDLVIKGEDMAGNMMRVAGRWHDHTPSPAAGKTRRANFDMDDVEPLRKYSRMGR